MKIYPNVIFQLPGVPKGEKTSFSHDESYQFSSQQQRRLRFPFLDWSQTNRLFQLVFHDFIDEQSLIL